jgi:hypothetical protein
VKERPVALLTSALLTSALAPRPLESFPPQADAPGRGILEPFLPSALLPSTLFSLESSNPVFFEAFALKLKTPWIPRSLQKDGGQASRGMTFLSVCFFVIPAEAGIQTFFSLDVLQLFYE